MLGADLVSFNHFDYIRHFLNSCTRLLGLECFPSRVEHNGRYEGAPPPPACLPGHGGREGGKADDVCFCVVVHHACMQPGVPEHLSGRHPA